MTALTRTATADRVPVPMIDGVVSPLWFDEDLWYTARVLGDYPPDLKRWHGDSDEDTEDQRADILIDRVARSLDSDVTLVHDTNSGAVFELWMDQPCGGGCRCAATVVWRPDVPVPEIT